MRNQYSSTVNVASQKLVCSFDVHRSGATSAFVFQGSVDKLLVRMPPNVRMLQTELFCVEDVPFDHLRFSRHLALPSLYSLSGMSLEQIAETLNRRRVPGPHGGSKWSARSVRKAFVS